MQYNIINHSHYAAPKHNTLTLTHFAYLDKDPVNKILFEEQFERSGRVNTYDYKIVYLCSKGPGELRWPYTFKHVHQDSNSYSEFINHLLKHVSFA